MKLVISAALLQAALLLSGCSAAKDSAAAAEKAAAAGDLDRAEVLFNQAIAQEDDQPLYYAQLGMVCVMQGEYEEAQSCFDTALQMDGGCTAALRGQGICKLRQGDAAGAVSSFSEALAGLRNQKSGTAQGGGVPGSRGTVLRGSRLRDADRGGIPCHRYDASAR